MKKLQWLRLTLAQRHKKADLQLHKVFVLSAAGSVSPLIKEFMSDQSFEKTTPAFYVYYYKSCFLCPCATDLLPVLSCHTLVSYASVGYSSRYYLFMLSIFQSAAVKLCVPEEENLPSLCHTVTKSFRYQMRWKSSCCYIVLSSHFKMSQILPGSRRKCVSSVCCTHQLIFPRESLEHHTSPNYYTQAMKSSEKQLVPSRDHLSLVLWSEFV